MRARLSLSLTIVLITGAGLACSAPPEKERLQAASAIADARRAGAARYAPTQLAAAEALMQKYETAVAARDYRLALSSALEANETAASAGKQAATEKARASAAAQAIVIAGRGPDPYGDSTPRTGRHTPTRGQPGRTAARQPHGRRPPPCKKRAQR